MKRLLTFTNNFHGVSAKAYADLRIFHFPYGDECTSEGKITLTSDKYERIVKQLCGVTGCRCGGIHTAEWPQDPDVRIEISVDGL
jgi:hypothetical protein